MLIPNKHNGYTRDGVRRVFFDGGGGGSSTATTYTSNVPDYAEKPFMENLAKGIALGNAPYQAYGGERAAQFTPLQKQAFDQADNQQVAGQIGAATGIAGLAGIQGLNAQFDPFQTGQFTSQAAQQYMNPFMQNVVDIQKREAQRASDIAGTQQQAQAVQRGAFGGSRDAIMRAERERNLAQQLGDIQATGSNAAFQAAQDQFNREQGMREASRQFGAEFGLRGGAQALQGAQTLGSLGGQQFGQEMDIMGARERMGGTQQNQIQRILDQQFADFQQQRDYPYQQIGFVSDLLRGSGSSTRSVYPQASPMQQLAGLGTAAYGLSSMGSGSGFRAAKGGEVPHYADGGIMALMGDDQLRQVQSPMDQMAAQEEMMQRQAIRSAPQNNMPQEADMTEAELLQAMQKAIQQGDEEKASVIQEIIEERRVENSGIAMIAPASAGDIPDGGLAEMAGGGMVSFEVGGGVGSPLEMTDEEFQRRLLEEQAMGGGRGDVSGPTAQELMAATQANPRMMQGLPAVVNQPSGNAPAQGGIGALGMGDIMGMYRQAGYDPEAEQAQQLAFNQAAQVARADRVAADRQALDRMIQERGIYGEEREASLKDEIEGLTGKKEDAKSIAIFQAGLAILSADPSRGAFAAIGEGALKGVGAYKGDLEKLEENRSKINERLDRISDIRRQERFADEKDRLALQKEESALTEANIRDTAQIMKGFGDQRRDLAKAVVTQAISSREAAARRSSASSSLAAQRLTLAELRERRMTLNGLLNQAQRMGEDEKAAEYVAQLEAIDAQIAGGGSQGGGGGGKVATSAQLPAGFQLD